MKQNKQELFEMGSIEFHGIEYTLQDGSTLIAVPHPEVKEEVNRWLSMDEVKRQEQFYQDILNAHPELTHLGRWENIK